MIRKLLNSRLLLVALLCLAGPVLLAQNPEEAVPSEIEHAGEEVQLDSTLLGRDIFSALPEQEQNERLRFYAEMIDDRMEDGMTEEEAVAAVGNTNEIAQRIHTEAAVQAPQQGVRVWLILLLVLGSPLWLSLYAALWAVIISLWAVFVSFAAVSLSGYVAAPAFGVHGNFPMAAASLGAGLFMTGCTIFLFFGCLAASKGVCRLTIKIFAGIRRSDGKERLQ